MLHRAFKAFVGAGTLHVRYANGRSESYGDGSGPAVSIVFHDRAAERGMVTHPALKLGECYMDGTLELAEGDLYDLLHLMVGNRTQGRLPGPMKALARAAALTRPQRLVDARRARANVAHHYDLDSRLYDLFLDAERQYSCAYFERADMTLDEAQRAKMARIAQKLAPRQGQTALDIGSGWGGLGLHLAREKGLQVTGVTLSEEQLGVARRRAADEGMGDRARFELVDYREVEGPFDRIVSVGMLEHVGKRALDAYFARVAELLADDGVALIHSISRYNKPRPTNPWFEKYIFPGHYIPALSEAMAAVERSGLLIADIEIWRLHYAETLKHWRQRFLANRDKARALHDERFCRMWEYYLASAEAGFRVGGNMVFQLLLLKDRNALPQTRAWMEAG
ncbi:MAG TPA: cyclopropane-fatty-acyl-phospholipid synthase family protein [Thermohalobaculum sp.]|nr:cyclopropane-fatty-acyl-phospholipid synthase family protein [Thermohalobaculum sp.]